MLFVALTAHGCAILSAHESVRCDVIFKPHLCCRFRRRVGSPFPRKIVFVSHASRHPARMESTRPHESRSAQCRSVHPSFRSGRRIDGRHDLSLFRMLACDAGGQGSRQRRMSRYGASEPSLVLLNVVSVHRWLASVNPASGRHASPVCRSGR